MDRSTLPRMPWHDISVRLCGAAAHDVEHHFVQRWNYLRRQKSTAPKRPTPMLLPNVPRQLDGDDPRIGSSHTSLHTQVQILRSVSAWSTGVDQPEHSIMNAYVELIESSHHFVYIGKRMKRGRSLNTFILTIL
jgi:phosphatidylserine/phosphatidylglycerophosphate/cardiolipin synthase-like enzyme